MSFTVMENVSIKHKQHARLFNGVPMYMLRPQSSLCPPEGRMIMIGWNDYDYFFYYLENGCYYGTVKHLLVTVTYILKLIM